MTSDVLKPLTPQQIEDALNEGRAESMAARGDNAWTSLLRQRDEARAEIERLRTAIFELAESVAPPTRRDSRIEYALAEDIASLLGPDGVAQWQAWREKAGRG